MGFLKHWEFKKPCISSQIIELYSYLLSIDFQSKLQFFYWKWWEIQLLGNPPFRSFIEVVPSEDWKKWEIRDRQPNNRRRNRTSTLSQPICRPIFCSKSVLDVNCVGRAEMDFCISNKSVNLSWNVDFTFDKHLFWPHLTPYLNLFFCMYMLNMMRDGQLCSLWFILWL